uniref:Uncharacterized protein n=1 Tax=Mycena chlorophos TaxID=658473 RepID=A0ABQ0LUV5_MYCCL|nr:predicted protein [Mycena chlorophos]
MVPFFVLVLYIIALSRVSARPSPSPGERLMPVLSQPALEERRAESLPNVQVRRDTDATTDDDPDSRLAHRLERH